MARETSKFLIQRYKTYLQVQDGGYIYFGNDKDANFYADGTGVKLTGAFSQIGALTVGTSGAGHRVTFHGDTAGAGLVWSDTTNELYLQGGAALKIVGAGGINCAGDVGIDKSLTVIGNCAFKGATVGLDHSITVNENAVILGNIELTGTMRGVGAAVFDSTMSIGGTLTSAAINASGTVTSSNTTAGFVASGIATDGMSITGACTDGIDISGACTNAIHITSTASAMGLLYDVDMITQIGANVEGVKVILERTADVTVATGTLVAGEFIVKKGDTGWSNKPATNVYGVRIAIGGSCTDASGSVMGLRCETQTNGYVDYLGYFSLNSGCSMAATGGVVCVNAFENANGGILVACSNSATMTVGLNFSDVNGGGTITSLLNIEDGANTTNFLKSTAADGCIAANTHDIDGHALQHILTVDIGGDTGYIPVFAAVPS